MEGNDMRVEKPT